MLREYVSHESQVSELDVSVRYSFVVVLQSVHITFDPDSIEARWRVKSFDKYFSYNEVYLVSALSHAPMTAKQPDLTTSES